MFDAKELCRRYGVSNASPLQCRSKYGGMEVPDTGKLKAGETANTKLKKLPAEHMMDVLLLKDLLEEKIEPVHWQGWTRMFVDVHPDVQ